MTYTEDQLTGWFDFEKQKPWEHGVFSVKVAHMPERDDLFSFFNGVEFKRISTSIDGAYEDQCRKTCAVVTKWRGLSKNPNAKPKLSGNKRKVMYVVMFDEKPVAAFTTAKECKDYVKRGNIWWTSIEKIRFRTPEHD